MFCSIFPFSFLDQDKVSEDTMRNRIISAMDERVKESGEERIRNMFVTDEFNNLSPELTATIHTGLVGAFVGFIYGGFVQSRIAYMNFMENNQATSFTTHLEAKKKLQDQVAIAFGKGAFKWGWRLGFFSTSYVLITTSISVYRGKSSILEYVIAGSITGALYKTMHGPRGMIVGGLLGTCLGAIGGGASLGLLKLTGVSMEEVRYWQYYFTEHRKTQYSEAIKKYKQREDAELMKMYNAKNANLKHTLDSIEEK